MSPMAATVQVSMAHHLMATNFMRHHQRFTSTSTRVLAAIAARSILVGIEATYTNSYHRLELQSLPIFDNQRSGSHARLTLTRHAN
eukprot:scaffold9304_cov83-Cyclotella_meneghiniana.AAC.2